MRRTIGILMLIIVFSYGFYKLSESFGVTTIINALLFSIILTAVIGFSIFLIASNKKETK